MSSYAARAREEQAAAAARARDGVPPSALGFPNGVCSLPPGVTVGTGAGARGAEPIEIDAPFHLWPDAPELGLNVLFLPAMSRQNNITLSGLRKPLTWGRFLRHANIRRMDCPFNGDDDDPKKIQQFFNEHQMTWDKFFCALAKAWPRENAEHCLDLEVGFILNAVAEKRYDWDMIQITILAKNDALPSRDAVMKAVRPNGPIAPEIRKMIGMMMNRSGDDAVCFQHMGHAGTINEMGLEISDDALMGVVNELEKLLPADRDDVSEALDDIDNLDTLADFCGENNIPWFAVTLALYRCDLGFAAEKAGMPKYAGCVGDTITIGDMPTLIETAKVAYATAAEGETLTGCLEKWVRDGKAITPRALISIKNKIETDGTFDEFMNAFIYVTGIKFSEDDQYALFEDDNPTPAFFREHIQKGAAENKTVRVLRLALMLADLDDVITHARLGGFEKEFPRARGAAGRASSGSGAAGPASSDSGAAGDARSGKRPSRRRARYTTSESDDDSASTASSDDDRRRRSRRSRSRRSRDRRDRRDRRHDPSSDDSTSSDSEDERRSSRSSRSSRSARDGKMSDLDEPIHATPAAAAAAAAAAMMEGDSPVTEGDSPVTEGDSN